MNLKHPLRQPVTLSSQDKQYIEAFIPKFEPHLSANKPIIHVCEPTIPKDTAHFIKECLESGWISSMGSFIKQFEDQFANFCSAKYAVSVTNGTHALELALATLGINPGDEVIIPTFTMIATANAVRYLGATPVFVDARPDTFNLDEAQLEAVITPKTKAIMVVHTYGHPADMETINRIADKHQLWVIEDAAEAHGARYHGQKVGSLGDIACFSFYANKMITTGEGGMVVTNHKEIRDLAYKLHNHAFDDDIHFWHKYLGYNFRMTNIQAAIGLAQLAQVDHFIHKRRQHAFQYQQELKDIEGIQFPVELDHCFNTYWMFGIVINKPFPLTRDELRLALAKEGVETRTFFIPLHLQPIYFETRYKHRFPVAEKLAINGLYLPSASHLSEKQISFICHVIRKAIQKNKV